MKFEKIKNCSPAGIKLNSWERLDDLFGDYVLIKIYLNHNQVKEMIQHYHNRTISVTIENELTVLEKIEADLIDRGCLVSTIQTVMSVVKNHVPGDK